MFGNGVTIWGEVERTKTVAAAVVLELTEVMVLGSCVTVVEGMRCWVVTMVGVTWAVGAEVV